MPQQRASRYACAQRGQQHREPDVCPQPARRQQCGPQQALPREQPNAQHKRRHTAQAPPQQAARGQHRRAQQQRGRIEGRGRAQPSPVARAAGPQRREILHHAHVHAIVGQGGEQGHQILKLG